MVERICWTGGKETRERRRYLMNSISARAKSFAKAVREHWAIENRLYWRLGGPVCGKEDANRIRQGNAPTLMTTG